MEKLQFLIHVFLILLKFKGLIMQNVTFYNEEKSWIDAASFCSQNGGVLESNVTLLLQHLDVITQSGEHEDIWLGKSKILTKWTYVRGCFYIYGDFRHFVIKTTELECQMLCNGYKFYSIKYKECYCIKEIQSFHSTKNCNCIGCYKVWEHEFSVFDSENKQELCIAVNCERGNLERSSERCENKHYISCDNGLELTDNYTDYQVAADECSRHGSFIKWFPNNFCETHDLQHAYWTSGTRHIKTFSLRKSYITEDFTLEKCFMLENNGEEDDEPCGETLPYFCTFRGNEDKGDIISIPTVVMPQQKSVKSEKIGSIAAGTVTSIVAVIAVMLAIILIHRKRLSNKKIKCQETPGSGSETVDRHINCRTSQSVVYNEIEVQNLSPHNGKFKYPQTVNNITYDYPQSSSTPKWQNVNQVAINSIQSRVQSNLLNDKAGQKGYTIAKIQNERDCSESVLSSDYCLAKPISSNTEEEADQYVINRDYDHLDNIKKIEHPVTKVYDHLPTIITEDPTYDHSNLKIVLDN